MLDRFSKTSLQILFFAHYLACVENNEEMDTRHFVTAFMNFDCSASEELRKAMGVELIEIAIEAQVTQPEWAHFSQELQDVLGESCLLAQGNEVQPEHLLISMIRNRAVVNDFLQEKFGKWLTGQVQMTAPSRAERIQQKIISWSRRAEMAKAKGMLDLEESALKEVARLEGELEDGVS